MKFKKKNIIALSSSLLLSLAVAAGTTIGVLANNTNYTITKSLSQNQANVSNIDVPTENNDQNANLSTNSGPVTFLGNTITALDWFGEKIWEIDFSQKVPDMNDITPGQTYAGSWPRAWYNWDYNRKTNQIWVLGYYCTKTYTQPIICIDATNGTILNTFNIVYTSLGFGAASMKETLAFRFISALNSGKVMVYGGAGTSYNATALLCNPETSTIEVVKGNSSTADILPIGNTQFGANYRWYFFNLIPIADNKNLVSLVVFSNASTTDDTTAANNATYDIYFLLVDDSLNMVYSPDPNNPWSSRVKVADHLEGFRNTQITPQRDYYTMLNGKVVTVVYNTVIVIDPTNTSNITYGSFPMTNNKWIQSWSFDANENLFFKFKDDGIVYKVSGDTWKTINNGSSSNVSPITYLDLSSITKDEVSTYANNFVIYNVYGFTGQLMLINSKYNANVNITNETLKTNNTDNYGLAIAVTQNTSDQSKGDYMGALNGPNSFQKSADFKLSDNAIASKIPSEITSSDIEFLNNGFLKSGDSQGFVINSMDDNTGKISITCNLYQIPWFSSTLPDNATPKTINHEYTTDNKIINKVSWKTLSASTDYDFMNMLPSNITTTDLENLDPFQVSFQSQTITNSSGAQLFPKKTYTVKSSDDTKGTVTVNVKFDYVPMSVNYTGDAAQVKTYTADYTYTVFNSSTTTASFYFIGQTQANLSQSIDISTIPQLKNLLEENVLPSSFDYLNTSASSTNSEFLQFINTETSKGYPISKMSFKVESNDSTGVLKISTTMSANYAPDKKDHAFSVTYQGLNKSVDYKFSFITNASTIDGVKLNEILPSSVTSGDIVNFLSTSVGFGTNDYTIALNPNDENGSLQVSVTLDSSYPSEIGQANHGFNNYVATYTFNGFMTTEEYNNRFNVTFVGDDDSSLLDLKMLQPVEIYNKLSGTTPEGLEINGVKYTNLNDLVEKLLVQSKGTLVPSNWAENSNIQSSMFYDNSLGTISIFVDIPSTLLSGSTSDLNLVVNYTGLVKGNIDSTQDNLSFVSNNMLKSYLIAKQYFTEETYNQLTPNQFAEWASENIDKLVTYKTGEYVTALSDPTKYEITVIPNDVQDTISINIHFNSLSDPKSLADYSIQYTI